MSDVTTSEYADPNLTPPIHKAIPLGIQHVLAMFASNVTPAIIIAGAAGFAFVSDEKVYMVQMAMLFAGVATLFQTVGLGPVGARLPIMQGTSFAFVSIMMTVAATQGGAGRQATDKEITGATYADGLGSLIGGLFGSLPNTSFSQNAGIVAMTGVMSRHVVSIAAVILIISGFIPKIGAVIASMPLPVLGGGVIVMFGMVAAAGLNMLADVRMNRRNMVIIAVSLAVGIGLNLVPTAVQYVPGVGKTLLTSGLLPTALIAIVLNLVLPEED